MDLQAYATPTELSRITPVLIETKGDSRSFPVASERCWAMVQNDGKSSVAVSLSVDGPPSFALRPGESRELPSHPVYIGPLRFTALADDARITLTELLIPQARMR